MTVSLWFSAKDKATNYNADIADNGNFESSKYDAKLLANTKADGILRNIPTSVPLKYLNNFWRSFKMLLIKGKVEFKFKWTNHSVLSDNDNDDAHSNNIIFSIKDTKLHVSVVRKIKN